MPHGNTHQQLPGIGQSARAALRSEHKRPQPVRFDAALRRGLKRRRQFGDLPDKPPKIEAPDPGDVLQRLASLTVIRSKRVDGGDLDATKLFHIGAFKNMLCVFEAVRRVAATQGGGYCDLTEAQLIAMLAHLKPAWSKPDGIDAADRAQNRRDQHITSVRRWREWMQDAGWLRYEVITDLSDDQLPVYTRYWINPAPSLFTFDDELLERCFLQLQRWVDRYGQDLETGARYAVPAFWARSRPEDKAVQTMKAIARGKVKAQRLRDSRTSKTVLAPPSGGGASHHNHLTTTATNRRAHTRLKAPGHAAKIAAPEPTRNPKNSSIEGGRPEQNSDSVRQMLRQSLLDAEKQANRETQARLTGFDYWRRDLTFDLEGYNHAALSWVLGGRSGAAPHPGKPLVTGPTVDGGYQQALRVYEHLLADGTPAPPLSGSGGFDRADGTLDLDAYESAITKWHWDGAVGSPPHPGHRPRNRRRDPAWHRAMERHSGLLARAQADVVDGPRGRAAQQAAEHVLDGRLLTAAADRELRAFWVTHRWGTQDVDARDLYGAGPELTDEDRGRIARAEAAYLAYLAGRSGWPATAVEAVARIANQQRLGELQPIDPGSQVGALRLLMDGVRRLAQEARRARNRGRAGEGNQHAERHARRQRRGDRRRSTPTRLAYRAGVLPPAGEPDYFTDPDAAFRWQLEHLPREILADPEGLPVLDDYGRFVMSPMYLPQSVRDTIAREHAANSRSQWRPVYLRLGLPLPPEHNGALYQTLKGAGLLPARTDGPLPGPTFLPGDRSLYELRNHTIAIEHGLYDQGHAYRALLRARLADLDGDA
jgi:hypothetical protein